MLAMCAVATNGRSVPLKGGLYLLNPSKKYGAPVFDFIPGNKYIQLPTMRTIDAIIDDLLSTHTEGISRHNGVPYNSHPTESNDFAEKWHAVKDYLYSTRVTSKGKRKPLFTKREQNAVVQR